MSKTSAKRTAREEELQIEVTRLKLWLGAMEHEAWKGTEHSKIEEMASRAIAYSSCAAHPDWGHTEEFAKLGLWP